MQLKLHDNLKKLRKEKGLTQEKLAEILDVSVGAVSKWENNNNTPDIEMLAILADFFDVSIDTLLGYDLSSKRIKDIVSAINKKVEAHRFKEAEAICKDALVRYPHDFSIIYTSAMMLYIKAFENKDDDAAKRSIELFESAISFLSQNDNPEINEFTINLNIATAYALFDEKKAIKKLKENNFAGVNDAMMALTYLKMGEIDESLNSATSGLIRNLFGLLNSASYMMIALSAKGDVKDIDSSLELCEDLLMIIQMFKNKEYGYLSKYEALYQVTKAYLYALKGDDKKMEQYVKEGKNIAVLYDKSSSNDIAKNMKFYYSKKDSLIAFDSLGESAVAGIEKTINEQVLVLPGTDKSILKNILDIWKSIKL